MLVHTYMLKFNHSIVGFPNSSLLTFAENTNAEHVNLAMDVP